MSPEFLTQTAWAKRLGVSIRTFRRWREANRIPVPDCTLPGVPRWSLELVEQTRRTFRRPKVGRPVAFGQKGQAFHARRQRGGNHSQLNRVSSLHAGSMAQDAIPAEVNSIDRGMR
jgi:hypothetical protein